MRCFLALLGSFDASISGHDRLQEDVARWG
jgi:hypothetical protein